jgi:hypothetical protein
LIWTCPSGTLPQKCRPKAASTVGIFKHTQLYHGLGAAVVFLVGLEDELDRSMQMFPQLTEDHGHPQQVGRMAIVTTGVHLPRNNGFIVQAGVLLDGQGIHVCPEHKGPARVGTLEDADDTGGFDLLGDLDSQFAQFIGHDSCSSEFLVSQFGVPVEVVPQFDDPGDNGFCKGLELVCFGRNGIPVSMVVWHGVSPVTIRWLRWCRSRAFGFGHQFLGGEDVLGRKAGGIEDGCFGSRQAAGIPPCYNLAYFADYVLLAEQAVLDGDLHLAGFRCLFDVVNKHPGSSEDGAVDFLLACHVGSHAAEVGAWLEPVFHDQGFAGGVAVTMMSAVPAASAGSFTGM